MAMQGRCKNTSCPQKGYWEWDKDLPLDNARCPRCNDPLSRTSVYCLEGGSQAKVKGKGKQRHLVNATFDD